MVAPCITVTLSGRLSPHHVEELLTQLRDETDLDWHSEERQDDDHLVGIAEVILIGYAIKVADKVIEQVTDRNARLILDIAGEFIDKAKPAVLKVIERLKARLRTPPDITVEASSNGALEPLRPPEQEA